MKHSAAHIGMLLLAVAVTASAAEYTVSSDLDDGGGGTLRVLIDGAAASGDMIKIPEAMTIVLTNEIAISSKSLDIIGNGAGANISGGGLCRLFNVTANGKTLGFYNLCFTNGYHSNKAGAFYVDNYATVIISNCAFNANVATTNSAAIFVGSTTRIYDTVFDGNTSAWAGCYYVQGALTMERCTFINNSVSGTGGVGNGRDYGISATTVYRDCLFSNNIAKASGCIYVNSKAVFDNCEFVSNTSTGGCASAVCNIPSGTIFSNCVFRDNIAWDGGALYLYKNPAVCVNCTFTGNQRTGGSYSAVTGGSAIGSRQDNGAGILSNCIFRANTANDGVVSTYDTSGYIMYNCLFESNVCSGARGCLYGNWLSLNGCLFVSNQLTSTSADQYLVKVSGDSLSKGPSGITNCTFIGEAQGASVSRAKGAVWISSPTNDITLAFCTIRGFRSNEGAVRTEPSDISGASLRKCVFYDNLKENLSSAIDVTTLFANVEHCFFSAAAGAFSVVAGGQNENNLYAATAGSPQLMDPADNEGVVLFDGSILKTCAMDSASPLINAGGAVSEPPTDARGLPRCDPISSLADIGAYESHSKGTIFLIQ